MVRQELSPVLVLLPPMFLEVPLQVLAPFSCLRQRRRGLSPVSH